MGTRDISEDDKNSGREIPDIGKLLDLDIAKKARLTRAEVVAVVLYTGPMASFRLFIARNITLLSIAVCSFRNGNVPRLHNADH